MPDKIGVSATLLEDLRRNANLCLKRKQFDDFWR